MSADAWIECPFCSEPHYERINNLDNNLKQNYDKLTAKHYMILKTNINKLTEKIEKIIEDKAYCTIYNMYEYHFDDDGNFITIIDVKCQNCRRHWKNKSFTQPIIKKEKIK